jgi:hypothetical protein
MTLTGASLTVCVPRCDRTNRSGIDIDELLSNVPPLMRSTMMNLLYSRNITAVPMFRGLSEEVLGGLCLRARPMYVLPKQTVMVEGMPGREMCECHLLGPIDLKELARDHASLNGPESFSNAWPRASSPLAHCGANVRITHLSRCTV